MSKRSHRRPDSSALTRGWVRVLVAVAAGVLLAVPAGCGDNGDGGATGPTAPTSSRTAGPSPSPSPSVSPTSPGPTAAATTSGVYFMVDTRAGLRLVRELRDLPGDDPAKEAVATLIAGADDPDYTTPWNPATRVLGVTRAGKAITVDLSAEARTANIGSEGAALMIQQLVYTVTEAVDKDATVRLLIAGEPAGELWGAVSWDQPVARADPVDVRALVQIDTPREGATSSSPLTVAGEAAAFEATVPWRVLDASGKVVKKGVTMTSEGQTFAPYSFTVTLSPGSYTVEISEDDPSGGEGGTPTTDTRTVTIR